METPFKQENKIKNNKITKDICHASKFLLDKIISVDDLNLIN